MLSLLDAHAPWGPLPLSPAVAAWQAVDELPLWQALEAAARAPVPPPMFALAWPGSQALAHLILSRSIPVDTLSVLDVGCGSGVAATAAALCGAHACAVDIDPSAVIASVELARRHGVSVAPLLADPIADPSVTSRSDVILGGDLFYCEPGARKGSLAVRRWLAEGRAVYLADAGRPFFDPCGLPHLWTGCVPVPRVVEGVSTRTVRVYGPRR